MGFLILGAVYFFPLPSAASDEFTFADREFLKWSEPLWGPTNLFDDGQAWSLPPDTNYYDSTAEFWWQGKWGVSGRWLQEEDNRLSTSTLVLDYYSLDLKRRLFGGDMDDYLAVGLGWENLQWNGNGSEGPRVVLEGRVGIGDILSFYGQTAWMPELYSDNGIGDLEGNRFEAGISLQPAPHFSLRAGYRHLRLDPGSATNEGGGESNGFILGGGFHW